MKLPNINLKLFVAWLALCAVGGTLLAWLSGMPIWGGAVIVAVALFVNAVIAEVEDSASGGFNNPGGKVK